MISTVTIATISTVTTVAIAGSLSLIGVLLLFALVVQKEVVTSSESSRLKALGKILNVAIIPLLVGFWLLVLNHLAIALR